MVTAGFPIVLGIKRRLSRLNDPKIDEAEAEFNRVRPSVLKRDGYTCQGCGFTSYPQPDGGGGYIEVHHIDDDHHNNSAKNLTSLCPFCHSPFTLGKRGANFAATLGYMPSLMQTEINLFAHVAFGLSKASSYIRSGAIPNIALDDPKVREAVPQINKMLDAYSDLEISAKERINLSADKVIHGIGDIESLYSALQELSDKEYASRHLFLDGLRLFPVYDAYQEQIGYWAKEVWLKAVPPPTWDSFLKPFVAKVESLKLVSEA
jgi:intracellular multiplication protein IcmJ